MSASARPNEPFEDRLLAALPADEYERMRPRLQPVSIGVRRRQELFPLNGTNSSAMVTNGQIVLATKPKTAVGYQTTFRLQNKLLAP